MIILSAGLNAVGLFGWERAGLFSSQFLLVSNSSPRTPYLIFRGKYSTGRSLCLSYFRLTGLTHLRRILHQSPISWKQLRGLRKEPINQVTSFPCLGNLYSINLSSIRLNSNNWVKMSYGVLISLGSNLRLVSWSRCLTLIWVLNEQACGEVWGHAPQNILKWRGFEKFF